MTIEAGYDDHSSYPASFVSPLHVLPLRPSGTTLGSVKTCDFCGKQADDDAAALTWTTAVENGRKRSFCETCSREHLRAMESQLDSEWW